MESTSFAVALIILAVARLGNCAAVDRELRRIKHKINNIQQNINGMQQNIEDLEFENRELRNALEGDKNWTSPLEKQLNSASSKGSPAVTDNVSRDSTVEEKIQKMEGVINLLAADLELLKSKSDSNTNKLEVTVRKAFVKEKAFLRKLNGTIRSKQEVATREVHDFMAKSNKSLERHIEAIENLHNATSDHEEAILEMTAKLGNIITAMGNTDIRISQNEMLLTALSGNYSNLKTEDIGNLYNYTSEHEKAILEMAIKLDNYSTDMVNTDIRISQTERLLTALTRIYSNLKTDDIGNLNKSTSKLEETILEMATKLDRSITTMGNTNIRISQNERLLTALSDCGSHKGIPNGDVSGDSFVGGTPVISCNSGYSQTGSARCKAPVFWETDVNCQKDCAEFIVANGMANPSSEVPHGTEVTVVCDSGYTLFGNSAVICNKGYFAGLPSCFKDCAGLTVANGMAYPSSQVPHGTEVTVVCDSGYTMFGNSAVVCKNGDFSGLSRCFKDCAILEVDNGMVTPAASVPHGTTVTVTCDSGYPLVGNNTAVCDNGDFMAVPSCGFRLTDVVVGSRSSFTVRMIEDEGTPYITGAEFLSDGRLILCDFHYQNRGIKLLSKDFSMINSLKLQERPFDVSAVNSSTVIVTLPYRMQLQYVHVVPHFKLSSSIQLDKWCWGVDVVGNEIFTSCYNSWGSYDGEVKVLDIGGTLKRRLGVRQDSSYMFVAPEYLTVSFNTGYIYVSDLYTDKVTCLSSAGEVMYVYGDPELDSPRGIYVDDVGNTIVCGRYSHNIHIITAGGKRHRILLTSSDGLGRPYSVAYRHSDATLVIGRWGNNNLLAFNLEN